jgi:hypothetical protein
MDMVKTVSEKDTHAVFARDRLWIATEEKGSQTSSAVGLTPIGMAYLISWPKNELMARKFDSRV